MITELEAHLKKKLQESLESFTKTIKGLRTGRASPSLLEPIHVPAYGGKMPLNQLATVSVQGSNILHVQVWDQALVGPVDRSIQEANLGLNPLVAGTSLKIKLPDLTQERRIELTKQLSKYAEEARISMRNIRRQSIDQVKKAEKDKEISEDDVHRASSSVQKILDSFIAQVDQKLAEKEKELMTL